MPGRRAVHLRHGYWSLPYFVGFIPRAIMEFVFLTGAKGGCQREGFEDDLRCFRGESLLKM